MSTQHTDHDTLQRIKPARAGQPAARVPATSPLSTAIPLDHHGLAREWLQREECLHALRVADPGRGRFNPFRETIDTDLPVRWRPTAHRNPSLNLVFRDYRRLLKLHADWMVWRGPCSTRY